MVPDGLRGTFRWRVGEEHDWQGVHTLLFGVFIAVFIYSVASSLLIRETFTASLARFSPDSETFERVAVELAAAIRAEGWGIWSLAPNKQAPVGLAAALTVVVGDVGFAIVLLNATFLALATVALTMILSFYFSFRTAAIAAVVSLCLLPSVLVFGSVLHKDTIALAGQFTIAAGIGFTLRGSVQRRWRVAASGVALVGLGAVLLAVVRPYTVAIAVGSILCLAAAALLIFVFASTRARAPVAHHARAAAALLVCATVAAAVLLAMPRYGPVTDLIDQRETGLIDQRGIESRPVAEPPGFLDRMVEPLVDARAGFQRCCSEARTAIDADTWLSGFTDVVSYLPRAIMLAAYAPLPEHWPDLNDLPSLAIIAEFLLLWTCVTIMAILARPDPLSPTPIFAFLFTIAVVYAIAVPNAGTLMRMKLPLSVFCIAVVLALAIDRLGRLLRARRPATDLAA